MAKFRARVRSDVIAWGGIESHTDANTEAIISFFFEAEAIYAGQYTKARERCSRPWHPARRGSQRTNSCSKTDGDAQAKIKVVINRTPEIANTNTDADIHTGTNAITKRNANRDTKINRNTDAGIGVNPDRNAKDNRDTNSYPGFSADED